jgi:hypothetical protein
MATEQKFGGPKLDPEKALKFEIKRGSFSENGEKAGDNDALRAAVEERKMDRGAEELAKSQGAGR